MITFSLLTKLMDLHEIFVADDSHRNSPPPISVTACTRLHKLCIIFPCDTIDQRCTAFLAQGPQCIIFSALEDRRQNYDPNVRESSINNRICFYLTSLYVNCGLMV